ncbi:MAG: DUF2520 domain-containing protein [Longimicrobiales bacterium]|nr:DUF2520 domain-containing protein [Longimicrobiales bacterium]
MSGTVAIVGSGEEALNLAEELADAGHFTEVVVYGRQPETPSHTVFARGLARYVFGLEPFSRDTLAVFLAVPETGIPEIAFSVAGQGDAPPGCAAFHMSPVLPTEALAPLHPRGYALGSFHPLGSPADTGTARSESSVTGAIRGGFVAVTGSPSAVGVARRITDALEARVLEVPAGRRPLVDAATVMVGSYLDPLMALSSRLMERAGVPSEDAAPALVAVARASLDRLDRGDPRTAPGNPVLEGDVERVALHLRALDAEDQRLYALLATEILRLSADEQALDPETRHAMEELLARYTHLEPTNVG